MHNREAEIQVDHVSEEASRMLPVALLRPDPPATHRTTNRTIFHVTPQVTGLGIGRPASLGPSERCHRASILAIQDFGPHHSPNTGKSSAIAIRLVFHRREQWDEPGARPSRIGHAWT